MKIDDNIVTKTEDNPCILWCKVKQYPNEHIFL